MREIKFRAWIARHKVLKEVKSIHFGTGKINVSWKRGEHCAGGNLSYSFDEIELDQFTGLADNEGREIYENDIIIQKVVNHIHKHVTYCTGIVRYGQGTSMFYIDQGPYMTKPLLTGWLSSKTEPLTEINLVLGNTHENPELIETVDQSNCKKAFAEKESEVR